jgi:hypothetical protein
VEQQTWGKTKKHFAQLLQVETDDCVIWQMGKSKFGYGKLRMYGKNQHAHRLALIAKKGLSAHKDRKYACHRCNTPACMNYRHLYWGTASENMLDRRNVGTNIAAKGEEQGSSKLKKLQVINIRNDDRLQSVIAIEYNVSQSTISNIKRGKVWGWL